jgi:cytochrome c-type biogenesis protein
MLAMAVVAGVAILSRPSVTSTPVASTSAAAAASENSAPAKLTAGQLVQTLTRSTYAANDVTLEIVYQPPAFFELSGQTAPTTNGLVFFLQEDTHIDGLDSSPAKFYVAIDGRGEYYPVSGTIYSDSGHHRTSQFVFAQDLPVGTKSLTVVFPHADGTISKVDWQLPLNLTSESAVAAAPVESGPVIVSEAALSSMELSTLNGVLRKVRENVVYGGSAAAELAATLATPNYFQSALSPESARRYEPEKYAVFMISENAHTADLPKEVPPLSLSYQGQTYAPNLVEPAVTSSHHRVTMVRFPVNINTGLATGALELRLPDGSGLTWNLPIAYQGSAGMSPLGITGASILSLVGGMIASMWPCLFQLTVFFIPALAGLTAEEARGDVAVGSRLRVMKAAGFFILGFTIVYTAAGTLIGFAVQQFGSSPEFETWQRYLGIGGGIAIIILAIRTAARARAPLVCKMPVLSRMAHSSKASSPLELMMAGLAFATGCMTCFGAALIIAMVVYVGTAGSALVGGLTLFLFSMGMGIPLVIAAAFMAKVLPTLTKLERVIPWMGLASSLIMVGFAVLLITGNYMAFTTWVTGRL